MRLMCNTNYYRQCACSSIEEQSYPIWLQLHGRIAGKREEGDEGGGGGGGGGGGFIGSVVPRPDCLAQGYCSPCGNSTAIQGHLHICKVWLRFSTGPLAAAAAACLISEEWGS